MKRFLITASLAICCASAALCKGIPSAPVTGSRPAPADRNFVSSSVDSVINTVAADIADPKLRQLFINCFPNTLDTTVDFRIDSTGMPLTFILTGDIHAMWLRDSSAQVWPYLQLAAKDNHLARMIAGLIRRQAQCILIDPYANAFNDGPTGGGWESDITQHMVKELHERKWELDSPSYAMRLAYQYWKLTGDTTPFDAVWRDAMALAVETIATQQRKNGLGPYSFQREDNRPTDSQMNDGFGAPVKPNGLVYSAFRPSDDATVYGFLVPSNMLASVSLRQLSEMATAIYNDTELATRALSLSEEIDSAIRQHAVFTHPVTGKQVYAFEVDGFGNALFMDDANVPSLLAAPYMGYCSVDDPVYQNTRALVWSHDNPYFFSGPAGEGIGGPHVGFDAAWPMSIIMKALTSTDAGEIATCLRMLRDTDAGTGFMHETFNVNDAAKFTRPWFAWANTLFGELVLKVHREYPELLSQSL